MSAAGSAAASAASAHAISPHAAVGRSLTLSERKRWFDDLWLFTIVVAFAALAAPWFLHALEVDLAPIAWSLFGYAALYLGSMFAADRLRDERALLALALALQGTGVLMLGWVWHLAGGPHSPMLLPLYALPVLAGAIVARWLAGATALLAVATVYAISIIDAPELRWYLAQAGAPVFELGGAVVGSPATPFPGLSAPAAYSFVNLQLFAVVLCALALLGEALHAVLMRLDTRLHDAQQRLGDAQSFVAELVAAAPLPSALVDIDTLRVTLASESFLRHFRLDRAALAERDLFGLVSFSYPEVVQELIRDGDTAPLVTYQAGGQTRIGRVQVQHVEHAGVRYAHLGVEDVSEPHCLHGMLDALDEAWIAIGAGRVLHANRAAQALLGGALAQSDAAQALARPGLPDDWWALGPRSEHERQIAIDGRTYLSRSLALRIPGEREALTLLALRAQAGVG